MTDNFFEEEAPRMPDWLSKAAEENLDFLEVKEDREAYIAPEYNRKAQQQDHFKPERIHANNINPSEEKNENLESIFAAIDKEAKRYMMYGFSINDIQTKLSSQYPKHVLSKYIKESLSDFNDHYGILGNICIDASLIGKENPYSVISKIGSKNPTSILFVIDSDSSKYKGTGLNVVSSVKEIKISKEQAREIIGKLGLPNYLSLVDLTPVMAVQTAFKDFVENKGKIERVVGSTKRKQGSEHFSDHKTRKNDQIVYDIKKFVNADKDTSCEEDLKFYTDEVLKHIGSGTKYILKSSDIGEEKEFKIGFDKLVSNVISEFQKRYGSKISYSNVVSAFRLDSEIRKTAYKGSDIGICGVRFVSNKDNFKYASHNKELNKVFSGNNFNINDFGVDDEITEITEKVFMPELDG